MRFSAKQGAPLRYTDKNKVWNLKGAFYVKMEEINSDWTVSYKKYEIF